MFGYVTINKKDLSEKDLDIYRSYYCGICHSLRDAHGGKGRLTLSYDMVFLALLLTDLYDTEVEPQKMFCLLHPCRRCGKACNEQTAYTADMTIILAYFQCLDHWRDNGSKLAKKAAQKLEKPAQAAGERWPRQYAAVKENVEALAQAEARGETDLDLVAAFTGNMLAEIFVQQEDQWSEDLRGMGFYLGKFIYLMDAYEDIEKDKEKGRYNPLLPWAEEEDFAGHCEGILTEMMAPCARFFEHLPIVEYSALLRNVIYSGVWAKYQEITCRRAGKKQAAKDKE